MLETPIGRLRLIGWAEAVSYLLLLGVAMPLKYLAGIPIAVKIVGWSHGVLFMLFVAALAQVYFGQRWPFLRGLKCFIAALLPFGPFLIDKELRADEATGPGTS